MGDRAILGIDPGPARSAWLVLGGTSIRALGYEPNEIVVERLRTWEQEGTRLAMETIEPWGGFTGPPALDTKYWVGRFEEAIWPIPTTLLKRSEVLRTLGIGKVPKGQTQAAVRAYLVEQWGGGNPVKRDHPLHGVSGDLWSALAVAVAYRAAILDGVRP